MRPGRNVEFMATVLSSHVKWGRTGIEFWKHLVMIEATVLGLTAALRSEQLGSAPIALVLTWWVLAAAIALGCLAIWARIHNWQDHESFNLWSIEMAARIALMRQEGDPGASAMMEFHLYQMSIWTARWFPETVDPKDVPARLDPPGDAAPMLVREPRPSLLGFFVNTNSGLVMLFRGFVILSLVALVTLIWAVSA